MPATCPMFSTAVVLAAAGGAYFLAKRVEAVPPPSPAAAGVVAATTATTTSAGHGAGGAVFNDPNDPRDAEGRVHHLGVKAGDVANRVLSVGDAGRAERISRLLDGVAAAIAAGKPMPYKKITSSRGFITYTGTFNGVPVSIVATGMGTPMMDFVVRETRAVVDGPMAMLRYGTCGGVRDTPVGTVVVASDGSVLIRREADVITKRLASTDSKELPYDISGVVKPDAALSALYEKHLSEQMSAAFGTRFAVMTGIDASADSFYSSQGRVNKFFHDYNEELIGTLERAPGLEKLRSLEMETFHLFDLARASRADYSIVAAGAAMVLANRHGKMVLNADELARLEEVGGRGALLTLTSWKA